MDKEDTPPDGDIDMFGALGDMQKSMGNLMMILRFLPWLPSFFIFMPVTLIALFAIAILNGAWGMVIYTVEALIVGVIAALVIRYTVGRRIEKSLKGGMMPP
ncbi:MAG: hypothetical protein JXB14_00310 [Candidatus Altiarchaeota archaeon]|nr:hypothetical protein [Candidatus Altiarchaeota archaeon]